MKQPSINLVACILWLLSIITAVTAETDAERNAGVFYRNSAARNGSSGNEQPGYATRFKGVTWDVANWRLTTTELDQGHYQSRGSVANGYLGINVAAVGPFFELDVPVSGDVINGWPVFSRRQTFATISDFYSFQRSINATNFPWLDKYGGDLISGVPHWSGLILDLGDGNFLDATVKNSTISNFSSSLDMKGGILTWQYTWSPEKHNGTYDIFYQLVAHKLHVNQALVRMEITPSRDGDVSVVNVIDGYSAVRTDFKGSGQDGGAIYTSVNPEGINNVTAFIYAEMSGTEGVDLSSISLVDDKPYINMNGSTIAQSVNVKLRAGQTTKIDKFVGAASTDGFKNPRQAAKEASARALRTGYEESLKSHIAEWATVFPSDSTEDYTIPGKKRLPLDHHIIEASIVSVVNPYYLLQSTVSNNALAAVKNAPLNRGSIAVGGLTSDSYGGLVFWDADIWMQPGLVVAFPEASQIFSNYRVDKYDQALRNAQTQYLSSKNDTYFSPDAAVYPWTSGRFANCTATGPCFDYQYHLNGDIGMQIVNNWIATGDTDHFKSKLFPVYNSIATFFSQLVEKNGTKWTVTNMTDPDEFANLVDGGGYTMPLIATTLKYANQFRQMFGLEANQTWNEIAQNVQVSRDPASQITLEYTTMNGSTQVKQADIVLNTFPLHYTEDYTHDNALRDLDYYAAKQSPNGPAMTYAIFSIVANEVSPSGCSAYTYGQYSFSPYVRAPFFQFSEQLVDDWSTNGGTHPAYPFLTGNGGANQVAVFGYLGLRLIPDGILHLNPNLPPQIPHIRYRTFYWHGWPLEASANYTQTTIQRATNRRPLASADPKYANAPITVHVGSADNITVYSLPPSGQLVIPNRQIGSINTLAGNLVQCQPVFSPNEFAPGQFPISAVDGAASTKWQPRRASSTSSLTVTLPDSASSATISGFAFDWAQAPPVSAKVVLHDEPLLHPVMDAEDGSSPTTPAGSVTVWESAMVPLSDPYDPIKIDLNMIMSYKGNTTNVTLPSTVPAAKFATLLIRGNQALGPVEVRAGNGTGATVAEWSIVRSS
ncbi:Cell wall acid trehalase [Trichophyton interdigitale]|uniref:alpha,alpha-trehalase n=1 Tax=Trichophyton interdigitale TaxID=101480 RepID=A0A9P5CVN5_9EURO|nr:Cell wall acid trehalase [Trichophyton interdigitale]KAF3897244.1 Cell wall acid trehalase [Trichophyton interdigitale]KAG8209776.1 Cell wall acid trehalase [Trichophyton interdigitale]